jgi:hypothetical protein
MLHGRPFHSPQSKHVHFNLYRCTEFVTYAASSVFAVGYAYSEALDPPRVADSRVPKPWREADRDRTGERGRYPGPPRTRGDGRRGFPSLFPGGSGHACRCVNSEHPTRGGGWKGPVTKQSSRLSDQKPRLLQPIANLRLAEVSLGRPN